ncbi:MAG: hypothetical protein MSH40_03520 [Christensenella sp.]|nr:hypothetical protein [Christensenella sp.]
MDYSISNIQNLLKSYKTRYQDLSDLLCYQEVMVDKKIYNAYLKEYNQLKPFIDCLEDIELIIKEKEKATNEALELALNEAYMKEINKVRNMLQKENFDEYLGATLEFNSIDRDLVEKIESCVFGKCVQEGIVASIDKNKLMIHGINRFSQFKRYNGTYKIGKNEIEICVYPIIENIEDVDLSNIKIDFYRSSGAGGQNVNKVETAVRIYDYMTGIVVTCQDERSQKQNREKAIDKLKNKVIELKKKELKKIISMQKQNAKNTFLGEYKSIEEIFS